MSESLLKVQQIQAAIRDVLLNEWDAIGVAQFPEAHHEYAGYVAEVYQLVARKASQQEIFAHLWRVATEDMGLPGDKQKTESVAKRLFEMGQTNAAS